MPLDERRVRYWLRRRIGYGRLHAPYWFIGMEESCDDAGLEIEARMAGGAIEDVFDAHQRLAPLFDPLFVPPVRLQPTWRPLIATLLTATGHAYTPAAARAYQANRLGRSDGETVLAEMLPLPAPGVAHWPYAEVAAHIPQLATRGNYADACMPARVRWIASLVRKARPRFVVAYGWSYRAYFRRLFPEQANWAPFVVNGRAWAETALVEYGGVVVAAAITPHPVAYGNTNADWIALAQWLAEHMRPPPA